VALDERFAGHRLEARHSLKWRLLSGWPYVAFYVGTFVLNAAIFPRLILSVHFILDCGYEDAI